MEMEANQNMGSSGTDFGTQSSTFQDTVENTTQRAREAASEAQQKVGQQLKSSVDSGKVKAADTLDILAQTLSQSGQQLRSDNNLGAASQYVDRAGDQLRRASDYLRNTNVDEIVRNTEEFARRQPAIFIGGAFALGILAARFIKASQAPSHGSISRDRSLVPQSSTWTGDREAPVSGYREPGMSSTDNESDTDPSYTQQFGRDVL
jgi:ElaB/YqjD/DUF883 family membrane-anchored ribosome-binding protein